MIRYKSTRGDKKLYTFSEAVLKGIAHDGGLFVPEKIPQFTIELLAALAMTSYQEKANTLFKLFETDFSDDLTQEIVEKAYASNFDTKEIAPVVHLKDNQYILELWHGPTSAFKDMALQIMPLFFSEAVKKDNAERIRKREKPLRYFILVATSGDTGKAALEGYKDKEDIAILVLYPDGRVSQLQELQMQTQEGDNVEVLALRGDFDGVQTMVKDIFDDEKFNNELFTKYGVVISSANSINWGRLLPQIVYYVSSYLDLVDRHIISLGDEIDVVVPSGNFGNLLAAFYAKKMGLPIRRFVCASNANNVLTDFLQTGVYDINNRTLSQTSSPSMDILIASNIERLLYLLTEDTEKIAAWMYQLKTEKKFIVDEETKEIIQNEFYAGWVSNEDCLQNIKNIYDESKYLMDTHTSVAQVVADRYIQKEHISIPVVICATAHFAKFAKDIHHAMGLQKETIDEFAMLQEIQNLDPKIYIPEAILMLQQKDIKHNRTCDVDKISVENEIVTFLQKGLRD